MISKFVDDPKKIKEILKKHPRIFLNRLISINLKQAGLKKSIVLSFFAILLGNGIAYGEPFMFDSMFQVEKYVSDFGEFIENFQIVNKK